MFLKNYTSEVPVSQTIHRIEQVLIRCGVTGWKQTCSHAIARPIPCTVLDPFHGTGCTAEVAVRLGRAYVGIELNEQYFKDSDIRDSQTGLSLL
jgi:hypothetical protein